MENRAQSLPRQREEDRTAFVVPTPSAHAGVAQALRASYGVAGLPNELARLIAKLS